MRVTAVAAAVVEQAGRLLVTRRLEGTHLAGAWEFPGGKCEPGEDHQSCLARELREELGVESAIGPLLLSTQHEYGDTTIELHFYVCEIRGQPVARLGQEMRWIARHELDTLEFPPADAELIEILKRDVRASRPG